MDILRERRELDVLTKGLRHPKNQIHRPFESDVEILRHGREFIVSSTDSIAEEISLGLYQNPETWGWITAMSSASDLAASGCSPLGMLLSAQWRFGCSKSIQKKFYSGFSAALRKCDVPFLGGDSGYAQDHVFTSTILGHSKQKPLTRLGVRPGDAVFIVGASGLGVGPAISYRHLLGLSNHEFPEKNFRPTPSWKKIAKYRHLLSSAIDTSDGLAVSLAILSNLNRVGFELEWQPKLINPLAAQFAQRHGLPEAMLWMNDLGDLQTLVTCRERNAGKIRQDRSFIEIGRATSSHRQSIVQVHNQRSILPTDWLIQNKRNAESYLKLMNRLKKYFKS